MDHRTFCFSVFSYQSYIWHDEINDTRRGRLLYAAAFFLRLLCVCSASASRLLRVSLLSRSRLACVSLASASSSGCVSRDSYLAAYGRGQAYPSPKMAY